MCIVIVKRPEQQCISAKFTGLTKYELQKAVMSGTVLYRLQIVMIYDDFFSQIR